MRAPTHDAARISEEAAGWLMELEEDPSPALCEAFVGWLKHSPAHMDEFLLVTAAYRAMRGADPQRRIDVETLARDPSAAIVRLREKPASIPARGHATRFRRRRWWGLAASAVIALAALAWRPPWLSGEQAYATALGEQRTLKLNDGSVVYLNTQSKVRVNYSAHHREIDLLRGEALFVVESDPGRPFRVYCGDTAVQALGTQFNVYRQAQGATVSVIEGVVRIEPRGEALAIPPTPPLRAGEQARVENDGRIALRAAMNPAQAMAWRQRQLIFRATPLAAIATEFNRYNTLQIGIATAELGARPLTAVFNADNPRAFVKFLETETDLEVQWNGNAVLIRERSIPERKEGRRE